MLTSIVLVIADGEYTHSFAAFSAASARIGLPPITCTDWTDPLADTVSDRRTVPSIPRCCSSLGYSGSTRFSRNSFASRGLGGHKQCFHAVDIGAAAHVPDSSTSACNIGNHFLIGIHFPGHRALSREHNAMVVGPDLLAVPLQELPGECVMHRSPASAAQARPRTHSSASWFAAGKCVLAPRQK